MKDLHDDILEQATDLNPRGSFAWLAELYLNDSQVVRIANTETAVTFGGNTYDGYPFRFQSRGEENTGNISESTLTVSNIGGLLSAMMEGNAGLCDKLVRMRFLAYRGGETSSDAVLDQWFTIKSSSFDERAATFVLGKEDFFRVRIPRSRYSRKICRWQYRSAECGYGAPTIGVDNAEVLSWVKLTFDDAHRLGGQQIITVEGVEGLLGANGMNRTAIVFDETTVFLSDTSGSGTYTGGGRAYFGGRQSANIANATNASPIVVTCLSGHRLSSGDRVHIVGVEGNTAANGHHQIEVVSDLSFRINGSSGNGSYSGGGSIFVGRQEVGTRDNDFTPAVVSNAEVVNLIRLTTAGEHGIGPREWVEVSDVGGISDANGPRYVIWTDGRRLVLNQAGSGIYTSGGRVVCERRRRLAIAHLTPGGIVVVRTATPHFLRNGDTVIIAGIHTVVGVTGGWTVTVVDADEFILNGATGVGEYVSGGYVTVDHPTCDRTLNGPNGCRLHDNERRFGGFPAISRAR